MAVPVHDRVHILRGCSPFARIKSDGQTREPCTAGPLCPTKYRRDAVPAPGLLDALSLVSLNLLLLFGVLASVFVPAASCAAEIHVSPDGRDSWSGQSGRPNAAQTDGPLATLTAARDAA